MKARWRICLSRAANPNTAPIESEHSANRIRTPSESNRNTAPSRILWISKMPRAWRSSLTFTRSSLTHVCDKNTSLMRALLEIILPLEEARWSMCLSRVLLWCVRFYKFIGFYGKLAEAFVCEGYALDARASRNSLTFTWSSLKHLSNNGNPLMRALCIFF